MRKAEQFLVGDEWLDDDVAEIVHPARRVGFVDIGKVGAGIVVGGGLGLLGGVAAIAVSASVAEVILGGVITKVAGAVGGAAGLGWGLHSIDKKKQREKRRATR
ncbi:MAG: hypothetical protein OEY01_10560 [Desulfobulbaceae bacterium]|nr:hypothetical protein [Desulfobulbaceae bacterium]HIJ79390.1 hypothetical protein [Deltaproteobacteria bacterium]